YFSISLISLIFIIHNVSHSFMFFFFFNDTATTEIYTLSLHDALPISRERDAGARGVRRLDQPAAAHPGHRACGWAPAAHGGGLDPRESRHAAPGRCPPERPARSSHRAGLHGRRRAGGDAAPAPYGVAARRCTHRYGRHPR